MLAACAGDNDKIALLLPHSDPHQVDCYGNTALALALMYVCHPTSTHGLNALLSVSDATNVLHLLNATTHSPEWIDCVLRKALVSPGFDLARIKQLDTDVRARALLLLRTASLSLSQQLDALSLNSQASHTNS
jgi:hypothetical protein